MSIENLLIYFFKVFHRSQNGHLWKGVCMYVKLLVLKSTIRLCKKKV